MNITDNDLLVFWRSWTHSRTAGPAIKDNSLILDLNKKHR